MDRSADGTAALRPAWMSALAHELRNPLAVISNGIELIRITELPAERKADTVEMMERQVEHIRDMLDRLVDAARVISGELDLEHEHVDLVKVCERAVESVTQSLEYKQQALALRLPAEGTVRVHGDAARLVEVVSNLLRNAIQYTAGGGEIHLELTAAADSATLRVRDTGIGLPEELGPRIFEAFTRGRRQLDRAARGLGLGLPLVRALVELHGGTVEARSEGEGRGSEFRVDLPTLGAGGDSGPGPPAQQRGGDPVSPRRILVVDDEPDAAYSLCRLLAAWGHETRSAEHGAEALAAAEDFDPDVALLDLGLPDVDGFELATRLRASRPGIVLGAVTGFKPDPHRLEWAGFHAYLPKPVDVARLGELLKQPQVNTR